MARRSRVGKSGQGIRNCRRSTKRKSRRLGFERLEVRQLLAITVDTLLDEADGSIGDGDVSLRDAIAEAPAGETIEFAPQLIAAGPATILLTRGELRISRSLIIIGPGAALLTIDATGNDPTPNMDNGDGSRVFHIDDGRNDNLLDVSLGGLSLSGGDANAEGGAVRCTENLKITGSSIKDNSSRSRGGGIDSRFGKLIIQTSTISGNQARFDGGGIALRSIDSYGLATTSATIIESSITGNSAGGGGGISSTSTYLVIVNSTISGNAVSGPFSGGGGGIGAGGRGSLIVIGSTVANNSSQSAGGGMFTSTTTSVIDSTIRDNTTNGSGGGIDVGDSGRLTVATSTISGNSSRFSGGGISSTHYASVSVTGSTISGNSTEGIGGGLQNRGSSLRVANSTIANNSADRGGGIAKAFYFFPTGVLTIENSMISGNTAHRRGGGVYSSYDPTILGSGAGATYGESAGGTRDARGRLVVTGTTINGNSALQGAGVWTGDGDVSFTSSTISGNMATGAGGGLYWNPFTNLDTVPKATIFHSTIAVNQTDGPGGGIFVSGGPLTLDHTIVARNNSTNDFGIPQKTGPDLTGTIGTTFDVRYSLIGDSRDSGLTPARVGSPDSKGNLIGGVTGPVIDPRLAPLSSNGGPTLTHELLVGSPALDAGSPTAMSGTNRVPEYDQRGMPFKRIADGDGLGGARIDIGAVELQFIAPAIPGDYSRNGVVDMVDYNMWKSTIGSRVALYSGADGNGDGMIDAADYVVWRRSVIVQPNRSPVGIGDVFQVIQSSSDNNLSVLANDFDPDAGQTLSISSVGTTEAGGTASVSPSSQTIVYEPPTGFIGTDRFTYTASDGRGGTAQSMATVQILAPAPMFTASFQANLSIFINGARRPNPPANIGVASPGASQVLVAPIHTEAADGRIHIEPPSSGPPTQSVTANDFFTTWRTNAGAAGNNPNAIFNANQVLDHMRAVDEVVRMYVNGLPVDALGNYIIRPEDQIVISVEKIGAANRPTFVPIADQTVLAGSPLIIPLEGFDSNSTLLTFTATSANLNVLTTQIPQNNRSMVMTIQNFGQTTYELLESHVPGITSNIIALANSGVLDNKLLHRIINGFVFQGFDPTGTGFGHPGLVNFDDQFHVDLQHNSSGLLSMAKSTDDTNSSQIFSTDVNPAANPNSIAILRRLDFNHSIFAKQTSGENVRRQLMLAPTDELNRPRPDVVVQDVAIRQIGDKALLILKAPVGANGGTDVSITARDAEGNEFTQIVHVTVQPDSFNGSPFLSSYPQSVPTTAGTPVNVQLQVTDAENDPHTIAAAAVGLSATILFDNNGGEQGITPPGTTNFSHLGSNWSGGTVTTTAIAPLPSQGPGAYVFGSSGGQVTFDVPITQARFFFIHQNGQGPFTARAFDANNNAVGMVMSNPSTDPTNPGNFETLSGTAITRIEFTGGHVDNFFFLAQPIQPVFQVDQDTDTVTVTPPGGFSGWLAVRVTVQQRTAFAPDANDPVDAQVIRVRVLPAVIQAEGTGAGMAGTPYGVPSSLYRVPSTEYVEIGSYQTIPADVSPEPHPFAHDAALLAWLVTRTERATHQGNGDDCWLHGGEVRAKTQAANIDAALELLPLAAM